MEKAHIERSGCLAMGLNAINAYLNDGQTAESYVSYVEREFEGVIRKDLVYTIAQGLNDAVRDVEALGLPIEHNKDGVYRHRGKRSVHIFGERLKPILAEAVSQTPAQVLNRVTATNFIFNGKRVCGAFGYGAGMARYTWSGQRALSYAQEALPASTSLTIRAGRAT